MSIDGALRAGRAAAERLMLDTVTISRDTGETYQDPDSGTESPLLEVVFTSRCKVQTRTLVARDEEVGGRTATTVRVELHLPIDTAAVEVGDVCEVTAVGPLSDPSLLNRSFRVVAPVAKSYATARRLDVEEIVA